MSIKKIQNLVILCAIFAIDNILKKWWPIFPEVDFQGQSLWCLHSVGIVVVTMWPSAEPLNLEAWIAISPWQFEDASTREKTWQVIQYVAWCASHKKPICFENRASHHGWVKRTLHDSGHFGHFPHSLSQERNLHFAGFTTAVVVNCL